MTDPPMKLMMPAVPRLSMRLVGHLKLAQLADAFESLEKELEASSGQVALIVDCLAMTGYEPETRRQFVEWHRRHRHRISAVAILTDNTLWHMVIRTMAIASGQRMRPFRTLAEADGWAAGARTRFHPPS